MSTRLDLFEDKQFKDHLTAARADSLDAIGVLLQAFQQEGLEWASKRISAKLNPKFSPEDAVQDMAFHAFKDFRTFQGELMHEFVAWLRQILCNVLRNALDHHTADKRSIEWEESPAPTGSEGEAAQPISSDPSSLDELIRQEKGAALHDWIEQLSQSYQDIIRMQWFDDVSFAESGSLLGISESGARKQLSRAMLALVQLQSPSESNVMAAYAPGW